MQPSIDPMSVSRRPLDIEDYLDIVRRHRSWILGPAFAGLVIGVVGAFLWPNTYQSTGAVRIVPPQVSQRLVPSNISELLIQRVNSMYQGVTSRPVLTNLIEVHKLYPSERRRLPPEDVIELMRKSITMSPIAGLARFSRRQEDSGIALAISFKYEDARKAEQVCREIITQLINESIKIRSSQTNSTTEFFRDQLQVVRRELDEAEKKLIDYRMKNPDDVSESDEQMLSRISTLETNLATLSAATSRANQEKLQLEGSLRIIKDQLALAALPPTSEQVVVQRKNERLAEVDREIQKLEGGLAFARQSYKDDYPDVQKLIALINSRKLERDQLIAAEQVRAATQGAASAAAAAAPPDARAPVVPNYAPLTKDVRDLTARLSTVQSQIQAKEVELDDLAKQTNDMRKRISGLQIRLDNSPPARQAFQQLIRDRDLIRQRYDIITAKMQDSNLASNLENRQQGETLQLLEEPNIPQEPIAPKRLPIIIGGLGIGFALGAVLAGFREVKDTSLKNLKDVRAYTNLVVLGSVPLLESDFIVRRRRRLVLVAWSAALLVGILLMSGSVYYYLSPKT